MYVSVCTNSKYFHFYRDRNLFPYLKYNKDKIYIFAPSGNTSRQVKYEIISDTGVRSNIQRAVREYKSQCGNLRNFLAPRFYVKLNLGIEIVKRTFLGGSNFAKIDFTENIIGKECFDFHNV